MLNLAKSTEFNKRIPKQKFYENMDVTSELKKKFAEQIRIIYWKNKIAPTTINLEKGRNIAEIEVFELKLNIMQFDENILLQIDKVIPYHILFLLEYEGKYQAWIGYKEIKVADMFFKVEKGSQTEKIESKEALLEGKTFVKEDTKSYDSKKQPIVNSTVKYDLVGKLVEETGLTRKDIIAILIGIEKNVFNMFKNNPEEFIIKAAKIINDKKAATVIKHITYEPTKQHYDIDVFTDNAIKGKLDVTAMKAYKHLYDYIVYDSNIEREFAQDLDTDKNVAVYVKLPNSFFISTPVGKYNPDWAIAFYEGTVKHIYFVAETKGSMSSLQLRLIEDTKIKCARKHFATISNDEVIYDVVDSYDKLLEKLRS